MAILLGAYMNLHVDTVLVSVRKVAHIVWCQRHFDTVNDLVQEIINAWVWIGCHYRDSVVKGASLGRQVAH